MGFFAQYGLFVLKAFTGLLVFLLAVLGFLALNKKAKPKLDIIQYNNDYNDMQRRFNHEIKHRPLKSLKLSKRDKKVNKDKPNLFVVDFNGDMKASQVEGLRDIITAILSIANPQDEVVICLESPGGTVNGYGLAASQLQRIRDKKIPLTVCIDKVAASGGYLMSCVANRIVAAPFAIIGSIGVVAQLPNFHRWLKKHDIDVELITAGQYKRTLTLLGENTEKGRQKFQEDLEKIHHTFRQYVLSHRQQLDIDQVSTGEHWLAIDAYKLKLVDYLQTSDDYIIDKLTDFNVVKIVKHTKLSFIDKLFKPVSQLMQVWH
jgi:serine protease SohB